MIKIKNNKINIVLNKSLKNKKIFNLKRKKVMRKKKNDS